MLELSTMNDKTTALKIAIERAGGQAEFARRMGITTQAVSQWDEVPPLRVLAVERLSGVPRHELRPDLYPVEARTRARPRKMMIAPKNIPHLLLFLVAG